MNKDNQVPHYAFPLREDAQFVVSSNDLTKMSPTEMQKLAQSFHVYQVELERQSEALKKAQLQLQATKYRYQKLYDCAPIGFFTLSKQGYITDVNQAACELLALSKIQIEGTKQAKYFHIEDQGRFGLFFKQLLKTTKKQRIEIRAKQSDGKIIDVVCQGACNYINESETEVFLTLQDISEQKRVEQAIIQLNEQLKQKVSVQTEELVRNNKQLHEKINEIKNSRRQLVAREAKLNSIFNAAVEGIITINEKGIIESANSAAAKIFNHHANELIGKHVNKLMPSPHNELYDDFLKYYLPNHQTKIIGKIQQLDGRRKDGSLVPLDLSISRYEIDDKLFFTGMIRDVSERKRKELLDKQHLDELAHVTRMGLMGEMASGIAHEVNQPLAAIATYCQVSLSMLNTDEPDLLSLHNVLQKTENQALRAGQIISRMRAFITSNTLQRSTVDINELVDDAMDLARDECQKFSVNCSLELADGLPFISVDRVQIEQVLLNLIKNSIDAVSKLPKDKQRKVSVQTYLREDWKIEIRVKDNGLGINEVEQGKIFTPFFTTKESGMGMGLSICQSLINAHGGELRFCSGKNKGSTFYFTLPIIGKSNEN